MEKTKENWFKTILRGIKPFELIEKVNTASIKYFNLARAMSIFIVLLLSVTLVCAGNVTMKAGDFYVDGDLGIGTTSPGNTLDVRGTFSIKNAVPDGITITPSSTENIISTNLATNYITMRSGDDFSIETYSGGWQDRFIVKQDGKVGIGTASPGFKLDVDGDIQATGNIYKNAAGIMYLKQRGGAASTDGFVFRFSDNSDTMGIYGDGKVGIGTTSPTDALHIEKAGSAASIRLASTSNNNKDFKLFVSGPAADYDTLYLQGEGTTGGDNFANIMVWNHGGDVGIGTTTPTQKLDVDGNITADDFITKSKFFTGDALSIVKGIKNDVSISEEGNWKTIDHSSLGGAQVIFDYEVPIYEEQGNESVFVRNEVRTFKGQSVDRTIALLLKANQQLLERIEALEAKI